MSDKTQPWKAAWPPVEARATTDAAADAAAVEYGVAKGDVAVVDGTAANVKPSARLQQTDTAQHAADAATGTEYGVAQGDIAVVDGTAANIRPKKKTVRVVRD